MRRPDPRKSYAVLVGVGSYAENRHPPVPGAKNNVEALREVLTGPQGCVAPKNCVVVLDPATLEEVLQPLLDLGAAATDLFFFYYVGHGFHTDSDALLLTIGTTANKASLRRPTALNWDDLRDIIRNDIAAARKVVVLDSCYSGLAANHLGSGSPQLDIEGTYLLMSCPPTSTIKGGEPYTFFTGALLDVFRGGIANDMEYLTPKLVYAELSRRLSRQRWNLPLPFNLGTMEDLPLLPNPGYKSADQLTFRDHVGRWRRKWAVHRQRLAQNRPEDPRNRAVAPRTRATRVDSAPSLAAPTTPEKPSSGTEGAAKVSNAAKGGAGGGVLVVALVVFGIVVFNSAERHQVGGLPLWGEAPVNDNGTLRYELRAGGGDVDSTFSLPAGVKYRHIGTSSVSVALAQGCRNVEFSLAIRVDGQELYSAGFKNSATGAARVNSMTLPLLDNVDLDVAGTTKELAVAARVMLEPGCGLTITLGNFEVVDSDTEWILDVV